jgi:DNA-binding CsgD family transcriptional regulator
MIGRLVSLKNLLTPNTTVLGCALFLAINATCVWGGVFPFLPIDFQTRQILLEFFVAQSVTFAISFAASTVGAYFLPHRAKDFLVKPVSTLYAAGWACLIAAIYIDVQTDILVVGGGILLGLGSAGFYMLWQRLFASEFSEIGIRELVLSSVYATIIYLALYLIPVAVTALLIPVVFLPLFALSVSIKSAKIDLAQPMFTDIPTDHPKIYIQVIKDFWRSALAVGVLGFCSGVMRSLALADVKLGSLVNITSLLGMMLAALILLAIWQTRNIRLNVVKIFRFAFPFIITAFLVMPLLPTTYIRFLAAALYAVYSAANILMMVQCAQISRDRGVNPVFVFGFFGAIVYLLHDVGFIGGMFAESVYVFSITPLGFVSLVSVYLLAIIYFLGTSGTHDQKNQSLADVEFIALSGPSKIYSAPARATNTPLRTPATQTQTRPDLTFPINNFAEGEPAAKTTSKPGSPSEIEQERRGKFKQKIETLRLSYGLTARETEIMELIVKGHTVSRIADMLIISENTVRTHSKRIYTKLDVHKKQEIVDMLDDIVLEV